MLVEDVALLKRQLASLLDMVAGQHKPRDPSIDAFCARHGFSRTTYYNMRVAGKGPRETAIGVRRTITEEAEREWLTARQAEATATAKRK